MTDECPPRRTLGLFESEEGFCEECGYRVEQLMGEPYCPGCEEEVHHNEVEWEVVNTAGGRPNHIDEL